MGRCSAALRCDAGQGAAPGMGGELAHRQGVVKLAHEDLRSQTAGAPSTTRTNERAQAPQAATGQANGLCKSR